MAVFEKAESVEELKIRLDCLSEKLKKIKDEASLCECF